MGTHGKVGHAAAVRGQPLPDPRRAVGGVLALGAVAVRDGGDEDRDRHVLDVQDQALEHAEEQRRTGLVAGGTHPVLARCERHAGWLSARACWEAEQKPERCRYDEEDRRRARALTIRAVDLQESLRQAILGPPAGVEELERPFRHCEKTGGCLRPPLACATGKSAPRAPLDTGRFRASPPACDPLMQISASGSQHHVQAHLQTIASLCTNYGFIMTTITGILH